MFNRRQSVPRFGAVYSSALASTALTSLEIVAPASNVNGMIVHSAELYSAGSSQVLAAHTAAPNSMVLGESICGLTAVTELAGPLIIVMSCLAVPVFVRAGLGLYFTSSSNQSSALRFVRYTLK